MISHFETEISPTRAYFISEAPKGWLKASLDQHKKNLSVVVDCLEDQSKRWQEQTGLKPKDSHFSVILPIHDEERFLPSFIGSLMLADIPFSADIQFILVTNACSDRSAEIVRNFLSSVDPNFKDGSDKLTLKSLSFVHLDTPIAGKANALKKANELALNSGHRVAISIDTNNFIEPDALGKVFGQANRYFTADNNKTVLLSASPRDEKKSSFFNKISSFGRNVNWAFTGKEVCGWMMAWDTKWLYDVDGPPAVCVEDYALGVVARRGGFKVETVPEAKIWGFSANILSEILSSRIRYNRGKLQIIDQVEGAEEIVRSDYYFMRETFPKRVAAFLAEPKSGYIPSLRSMINFCLWEYATFQAQREYKREPLNQSWEPILSTK